MDTPIYHSDDAIFAKTAKGHEEIPGRGFGLTLRQRRVLIIMDGEKSLGTVRSMIVDKELDAITDFLKQENFIVLVKDNKGRF